LGRDHGSHHPDRQPCLLSRHAEAEGFLITHHGRPARRA
jgi:hypothetical protein